MIAQLRGNLLLKQPTYILVDVNGVGYGLHIPLSTYSSLGKPGEDVLLYTYLHVREDCLQLYGFATPKEKELFCLLISVTGVGPRLGLAVLSGLGAEEVGRAIGEADVERLRRISGVGKKTAERLVVELRDKVGTRGGGEVEVLTAIAPLEGEAVNALVSLGSRAKEARRAVERAREILGAGASLEDLIREALKSL